MSVSVVGRLSAFVDAVWSFILTLVRSLLALFSFRRRSADLFALSAANRSPDDALARAHSHLRPILLTPRSIARSPAYYTQRAQSTRTRTPSATSTLFPVHTDNAAASGSVPQPTDPQRTSPKLDPNDPELGLYVTASLASDHPSTASASSFHGGTSDTSLPTTHTTSLSVLPLTPPDRCYLAPMPSVTDCPYAEPWPANVTLDRGKPRLPGSPLKVSINTDPAFPEPMVGPMVSPLPGRWSPVQIWTSTPCKDDNLVPDPALSPFDHHTQSTTDPSSALAEISHALISRSRSSVQPYDDTSNSSTSFDASLSVNYSPVPETLQRPDPTLERHRTHGQFLRPKSQPYPRFHYPDAYACVWRRHGARVPGKPGRTAHTHPYARSHSHMDLRESEEWYDADAYLHSPASALSPPLCESATEDEDEDDMPLGRLKARLARRSAAAGATLGLGVPIGNGMDTRKAAAALSPRTRRMSEGCLLAISESTPTRVGVGARASRHVLSLALDGDGHTPNDWFEALSLRFSSEQKDALAPGSEPCLAVPSVEGVTVAS